MLSLQGKTAIVTGSNRGLGQGIALELSRRGATVVCADLSGAEETAHLIRDEHVSDSESVVVDVTSPDSVAELVDGVVGKYDDLDIMVNNAGVYAYDPIDQVSEDDFRRVIDVNIGGVFHGSREAARVMKQQNYGRIINTASQLGKVARPNESIYAASKAAVILLTQAIALELGEYNITANSICPGCMHTEMMEESFSNIANSEGVTLQEKFDDYLKTSIPVRRFGTAADMGKMVAWLASDDASFTTGSALNLTGGEQVSF